MGGGSTFCSGPSFARVGYIYIYTASSFSCIRGSLRLARNHTVMATPFKVKLHKAQSSCIEFDKIASVPLVGMCTALSDAIGCPVEFIFPLHTIAAACMGINAHVKVNLIWYEQAILRFIIAANKDKKKWQR